MTSIAFFDNRWVGKNGIGRYSYEIGTRIDSENITFITGGIPTRLHEIFPIFRNLDYTKLLFSPGYIAMPRFKRQIITIHDLILLKPSIGSRLQRLYFNLYLKPKIRNGSIKVVTVSESSRLELATWAQISLNNISIISNGLSGALLSAGKNLVREKRGRSLIYVGNDKPHKNLELLIDAARYLKHDWRMILVGSGLDKYAMPDNHKVEYYSNISDEKLASLYLESDLLVTTSLFEGFCMPVLEGAYLGCKVVHLGVLPTISEIIGDTSFSTDGSTSPEILAKIIMHAHESSTRMSENARKTLADRFDWEQSARNVHRMLLESISQ
jgi:glycosyltransferase involved in cell wall biosynthesis